jgi:hypothetical protein
MFEQNKIYWVTFGKNEKLRKGKLLEENSFMLKFESDLKDIFFVPLNEIKAINEDKIKGI